MLTNKFFYLILAIILISIFMLWQLYAYKVPEPHYVVIKTDENIEIREYPALLAARVEVAGGRYTAINKGFRILADFIFGNNNAENKIAMTAPVTQKITDTSISRPVALEKKTNTWMIEFIMPSGYTLANLPKPKNNAITILQIPKMKYVVIRFSGTNSQANLSKYLNLLERYISKNKLTVIGQPIFAFYSPPWILPFLRRNEIMFELKID
jgi:effector-binding domain-containing protein